MRSSALDDAAQKSLATPRSAIPNPPRCAAAARPATINAGRPAFDDTAAWLKRLDALPGKADAEAGRRIFFHPRSRSAPPAIATAGAATSSAPTSASSRSRATATAILQSILEPNREVAPQFYPTLLKLKDGTDFTGILLRSSSTDVFRDLTGKERTFQKADIVQRTELKTSLMPPGLVPRSPMANCATCWRF